MAGAGRLATGIEVLDRELNGGVPPGSLVAYSAPPASQAELLLQEITNARPTLYLTIGRSAQAVRDAFRRSTAPSGDPRIRFVEGDAPLENARKQFRAVEGEANLIVDPTNILEERGGTRYRNFLNALQNHMQNIGGVTYLYCLRGQDDPVSRSDTLHAADVVFRLEVDTNGSDIENRLLVPKFRGGRAPTESIKLELAEQVRIDTSRDIA